MDPAIVCLPSSVPVAFQDGFGERRIGTYADDAAAVLTLAEELTATASFEPALRDRVSRLAGFTSEHYARVLAVESVGGRLAVVSEHVPGVRLSEILAVAQRQQLPLETNAALCLMRQLVHAVSVLHDKVPELSHGAIGPERLMVTPQGRLVVVEHVLGAATEQLRYSNKQYWQQLRVALPRTFGAPQFDRRTDVTQVGATALALIVGRLLAVDDFPARIGETIAGAHAVSSAGNIEPLPLLVRGWLERALQIDSRMPFSSGLDAWAELDRALHYSDPIAELAALQLFLTRARAAIESAGASGTPTPIVTPPAPVLPEMQVSASSSAAVNPQAALSLSTAPPPPVSARVNTIMPTTPATSPTPQPPPAPPNAASVTPPSAPAAPAVSTTSGFWDKPGAPTAGEAPAPATEQRRSVSAIRPTSRLRLAAAAVLLIALTSGITLAARRFLTQPVAANGMGTLMVQSNPSGAAVHVDGKRRGVTPLSLDLAPGRHTLKLATEGSVRSLPVTITAGGQVTQFIELPRASSVLGELQVRTEPAGAQVTVDGHPYGKTPLTVEGLAPGTHSVLLENDLGSFTQEVRIEAGTTASLVVPMTPPRNAPLSGWITVAAPVELQVYEDGRLLGTSQSDRIMVSVGRHQLQIVNDTVGYRDTQVVTVAPGRVSLLKPAWPMGSISLNAVPWAEVWVDGQQVGETPLGNVPLAVGPHDVLFRHPELGEKRVRAIVTLE